MNKTLRWLAAATLAVAFLSPLPVSAKKEKVERLEYSIEGSGTSTQGQYVVTVTVVSKKKDLADRELAKAAVRGVLFRGFVDPFNNMAQKPLAGSPANEAQHADFYSEFFGDNGSAADYASVMPGSRRLAKVEKDYKVQAVVAVNKEALVKYLTDAGVIKSLNSIF